MKFQTWQVFTLIRKQLPREDHFDLKDSLQNNPPKSTEITGPLAFTSCLNKRIRGRLRQKAGRKNIFQLI